MMGDMISVIVPVYNIARIKGIFKKCIDSVLKQTYQNWELILVNDGSTDNTQTLVEILSKKDARIRTINIKNGGVESARREGLNNVHGQFVLHLDQDDILHKKALETLYKYIVKENADVVVAESARFWKSVLFSKKSTLQEGVRVLDREQFLNNYYKGFFGINIFPVNIWNKLYRKSFLDRLPDPPRTGLYNEDLNYNLHILPEANKIVWIDDILYYYRWGGFTTKKIDKLLETALSCYQIKMAVIKEKKYYEYEHSTCIELLNYVNSYFYQLIAYDQLSAEEFIIRAKSVLSGSECEHAISVIKKNNSYHNTHVDCMLTGDIEKLEKHTREIYVSNKYKRLIKKALRYI